MFERFNEPARQVVVLGQDEARALKHNYIGTEHILLGLLRENKGLAAQVLESLDIAVEEVRAQVAQIVGQSDEVTSGQIPFTPRAKKVLELALREAVSLGDDLIGTEHILLGLVRENEGVAARILLDLDADAEKIRNEIIRRLPAPGPGAADVARRARGRLRAGGLRPRSVQSGVWRWDYEVKTLAGSSDTWAEQLGAWREEGWELVTVVAEEDERRAILERRVQRGG